MPNYSRPQSSVPRKGPRSSLHPHGAPGFAETIAGLKQGLLRLGTNLVGAGAAMAGNLIGPLTNLRKSAESGDEDAEKAYQEALAMLRGSGSEMADSLLRDLGEEEDAEANPGKMTEVNSEAFGDTGESETTEVSGGAFVHSGESETVEDEPELAAGLPAAEPNAVMKGATEAAPPESPPLDTHRKGKVVCLECGVEFKRLTHTHLLVHGMDPTEYREKHGLSR